MVCVSEEGALENELTRSLVGYIEYPNNERCGEQRMVNKARVMVS